MDKYRIIRDDNALLNPAVQFIYNALARTQYPWYYLPHTVQETDVFFHHKLSHLYEVKDNWLYMHNLVLPNGMYPPENTLDHQIIAALNSLGVIPEFETHKLTRLRANCVHRTEKRQISPPHRDFEGEGVVYVYYVNESDGDTILFDEEGNVEASVAPGAGHFVRMDARQYHSATTPIHTSRRFVLNLNFEPK